MCILGSTGSIGCNSLDVIESLKLNGIRVEVNYLSTNTNTDKLGLQIKKFSPKGVIIQDRKSYNEFKLKNNFKNLEVLYGREGLMEVSGRDDYDIMINSLVGFYGLEPTVKAIRAGKNIAIANKETLVSAGRLVTKLAKENKVNLIPIDSEHSAILQCLSGEDIENVSKIILTASGGPFLKKSISELKSVTVEEALEHPNWKMGNKITIDSATMMNKGLEVIEAKWLFEIEGDKIDVLIHPQSIIHSMVEFNDGSVKAQLGIPDMKIPIQYSLTYPKRVYADYPKLNFSKLNSLNFQEPDFEKFKCLKIAYNVLKNDSTYPAVMNAANEIAVNLFLKKKIAFEIIPEIIENELQQHQSINNYSLEDIIEIDSATRINIERKYNK